MDRAKEDLLVLAAQTGDARAFEALFRIHNDALRRFAYRLSGDETLATDAVQEAWITLSKSLKGLRDPRGFRVWAYKTVRWRTVDMARKRGQPAASIDDVSELLLTNGETEPDATSGQLARHMAALKAGDRQLLALFYLEELKLTEIAGILEVPVGTVKSRLNRARAHLKDRMVRQHMQGDS